MGCAGSKADQAYAPPMKSASGTLLYEPGSSSKKAFASNASEADMASMDLLRSVFESVDSDADGRIHVKELIMALQRSEDVQRLFCTTHKAGGKEQGVPPVPSFFTKQVDRVHIDVDGKISFQEFEQLFFPALSGEKDSVAAWAALWKTFHAIDSDRDGELNSDELAEGLRHSQEVQRSFNVHDYWSNRFGKHANGAGKVSNPRLRSLVMALFKKMDEDENGKISWDEFATYFIRSNEMLDECLVGGASHDSA